MNELLLICPYHETCRVNRKRRKLDCAHAKPHLSRPAPDACQGVCWQLKAYHHHSQPISCTSVGIVIVKQEQPLP